MRRGRPEADLRAGQRPGRDSAFSFSRSRRSDRTYRRRRRCNFAAIAGYDAADKASVDVPVEDYVAALGENFPAAANRRAEENSSSKIWTRKSRPRSTHALVGPGRAWARKSATWKCRFRPTGPCKARESYAFHAEFVARTPELYQPETLRRIRTGKNVSPEVLLQCRRELERARREIAAVFADVDVLVTPTTPIPAPAIAELKQNPDLLRPRELLLLRNTRPINVWGLPAISVPCGFTEAGLPIGLQIIGPHWGEARVLQVAHAYEQATAWHKRQPAVILSGELRFARETQYGVEGPLCFCRLSLRL